MFSRMLRFAPMVAPRAPWRLPEQQTVGAAGYDLPIWLPPDVESIILLPGSSMLVRTGVQVVIPSDHEGHVRPRSSADKLGLHVTGTIDSDYRGEVHLRFHNIGTEAIALSHGDRRAQLIVHAIYAGPVEYASEPVAVDSTERGTNGFGSTGVA